MRNLLDSRLLSDAQAVVDSIIIGYNPYSAYCIETFHDDCEIRDSA